MQPVKQTALVILYDIAILLFRIFIGIASVGNPKARAWLKGRKGLFDRLDIIFSSGSGSRIWIHCASLGEFEQGRPLLEAIRRLCPGCRVLVTFFSPSGYENRKGHPDADHVDYIPLDTRSNAVRFLDIVRPDLAVFIKYEYWYRILSTLESRNVPTLLVSAVFRTSQPFFRPYGSFWRGMLHSFDRIFVQEEASRCLLEGIGLASRVEVSGDTRFDRVVEVASNADAVPEVEFFCRGHRVVVAGSTWTKDEELLAAFASGHPELRFVIAPHEVHESHLAELEQRFPSCIRLSRMHEEGVPADASVLIIDGIGLLSRLYRHADLAYVGGGFNRSGIHNILEAAVYGKPVFFGPIHSKSREAGDLIAAGGAFAVADVSDMRRLADPLLNNLEALRETGSASEHYVQNGGGATGRIMEYIQRNRLLTNPAN